MRRGQFVVVATSGDYGKPRPALIVQSELFAELPSVVICPLRRRFAMTRINSGLKSSRPSAMDSARFRKSQSTKSPLSPSPKSAV